MNNLWIRDYGELPVDTATRRCHHCETEFARGARITWDPNKVRSEGRPGVAYLCVRCRRLLDNDDPGVVATVTQHINEPTPELEPTLARVIAVYREEHTVNVMLAGRAIEHVPCSEGSYPSPAVGDLVEISYLARDWAEEADLPVADDEWIVLWKLPKPTFRARPDGGVDVEFRS